MADIYIMAQNNTSGHITGHDLAEQVRKRTGREIEKVRDALRKKLGRLSEKHPDIFPDASWSLDRTFTPNQSKMLAGRVSARRPAKKSQTVSTPTAKDQPGTTPAPSRLKLPTVAQVRTAIFDTTAIGVIVGHGFLIWQEAAELYGYIGAVGGFVVFLVVCLAVLLASDSSKNRTSEYALYFMFFVDAAAGFVHFEALSRPDVPHAMTIGFCIFICACSWVALLLYRDSKQD